MASTPAPPFSVSLPPRPIRVSSPTPPVSVSLPAVPVMVLPLLDMGLFAAGPVHAPLVHEYQPRVAASSPQTVLVEATYVTAAEPLPLGVRTPFSAMSPDAVIVHTLPEASVRDPPLVGVSTICVGGCIGGSTPPVTVKPWAPAPPKYPDWLVFTPL